MTEREAIIAAIDDLFVAVDNRDWDAARRILAPRVRFDMTSLAGGEAATVGRDDIISGWEQGLRPIRAVHHQAGNYRVTIAGETAEAFCYATAYHLLPENSPARVRTFVGSYEYTLGRRGESWEITGFRFNCKFVEPPL